MHRCVSCCLVLAFTVTVSTSAFATEPLALPRADRPLATFVRGLSLIALSGLAAAGNIGMRRAPLSLVQVVWPTLQPATSDAAHPPIWSRPDGGRKTLFFATLVDVHF